MQSALFRSVPTLTDQWTESNCAVYVLFPEPTVLRSTHPDDQYQAIRSWLFTGFIVSHLHWQTTHP